MYILGKVPVWLVMLRALSALEMRGKAGQTLYIVRISANVVVELDNRLSQSRHGLSKIILNHANTFPNVVHFPVFTVQEVLEVPFDRVNSSTRIIILHQITQLIDILLASATVPIAGKGYLSLVEYSTNRRA